MKLSIFSFSGSLSRSEYLRGIISSVVLLSVIYVLLHLLLTFLIDNVSGGFKAMLRSFRLGLKALFAISLVLCYVSLSTRRCYDLGVKWYYQFIPLFNFILFLKKGKS